MSNELQNVALLLLENDKRPALEWARGISLEILPNSERRVRIKIWAEKMDNLRSINAELVAALQNLVALDQHEREAKATSYANGSPASKAWGEARAALERAKQ